MGLEKTEKIVPVENTFIETKSEKILVADCQEIEVKKPESKLFGKKFVVLTYLKFGKANQIWVEKSDFDKVFGVGKNGESQVSAILYKNILARTGFSLIS